ncbi:MAG: terminase small subunit [Desulfuromonadaceae bacterium]
MDTTTSTDFNKTSLSGQMVLHDFTDIIGYEAAVLDKPKHEMFCVAFVENLGHAGKAWQSAIDPKCSADQARKNASKLLKNGDVRRRISELSAVVRNRTVNDLIEYRIKAMKFDPANYFDSSSNVRKQLHISEAKDEHRIGVGLESRIVEGCVVYVPVFPSPEKSADALQKMMGLDKTMLEMSGKNGKPIETENLVRFYMPANGRD